ncbi:hypothetical protein CAPTEDRAFT_199172 [Capitella teleta]|uniref:NACHT domain-containing protein n=1 Tax=Capitella teleta TaxID=283909 RepID=R7VDM2_CAPTE|nr:hypothetical protein CAPTEDRAFT_199172 [Capitella teleta]|eukprot:ELU16709.1 hypothetical protein CAPTEDRAFT_199172 [Capitella teleta]
MGCGSSRSGAIVSHDPKYVEVTEAWDRAWETVSAKNGTWKDLSKSLVIKRTGWKTVRIFVSSTFKDFHCERELLVKKVFPDLRVWCENRRLYLVECDLRWGVPTDFTTEATLRACLGEIDRCFQDNVMPFFINMTSERVGWIPMEEEVPEAISSEYSWVRGLSVTEMEILHGAYRTDNPNALFMLRDPSFLKSVPDDQSKAFIDNQPIAQPKLDVLKQRIRSRFPSKRIVNYPVEFLGVNSNTGLPEVHVGEVFSKKVVEFFKERIGAQYPLDKVTSDPYAAQYEAHESFMKSRCDNVIGRRDIIDEIMEYICSEANSVPFLLVGNAGSGKSSIIAKIAEITATRATLKKIPGGGKTGWKVFYHFVGAVPGSTELLKLLMRLVKEIGTVSELPGNLESASQTTTGLLAKTDAPHWIIIVDALNQLDEDTAALINSWIPRNLSRNIRIVLSMIEDTPQHTNFRSRDPPAKEVKVNPLSEQDRREIVDSLLGRYNKRLDNSQMNSLMNKEWSTNPLWLAIACEELRVFGQFRQVSDKINKLEDGLLELEMQVLTRFEEESGGELLVATVSLLEISSRGLLEIELLAILGDEENLMPAEEESAEKS